MIRPFIVFSLSTGQILRTGTAPAAMIDIQAQEGESVLEATADPNGQYVQDGTLVGIPEQPSSFHVFDWSTKTWVADYGLAAQQVRAQRDRLIAQSDWTQLPDVPNPTRLKWQEYRQALRDVTDQPGFPLTVNWPEAP